MNRLALVTKTFKDYPKIAQNADFGRATDYFPYLIVLHTCVGEGLNSLLIGKNGCLDESLNSNLGKLTSLMLRQCYNE